MSWEDLKDFSDYEINTEYPYPIRKKGTGDIVSESDSNGYYQVRLNQIAYKKHRLVANQWIPNPYNLPCVDHIDRNRSNNHIDNLRWVTYTENNRNRTGRGRYTYELINELPEDSIEVNEYSDHIFENYYFSPSTDRFYLWTGIEYRILVIHYIHNGRSAVVSVTDIDGRKINIYYTKFKREYDLV